MFEISITAGEHRLTASLEDNIATRELIAKMPFTLTMQNRYGREMVHRLGAGALPTDKQRRDKFQVGDLVYWAPMGSLVILYAQDGERFERQHLGRIHEDVSFFAEMGDMPITFATA